MLSTSACRQLLRQQSISPSNAFVPRVVSGATQLHQSPTLDDFDVSPETNYHNQVVGYSPCFEWFKPFQITNILSRKTAKIFSHVVNQLIAISSHSVYVSIL